MPQPKEVGIKDSQLQASDHCSPHPHWLLAPSQQAAKSQAHQDSRLLTMHKHTSELQAARTKDMPQPKEVGIKDSQLQASDHCSPHPHWLLAPSQQAAKSQARQDSRLLTIHKHTSELQAARTKDMPQPKEVGIKEYQLQASDHCSPHPHWLLAPSQQAAKSQARQDSR